LDCHSQRLVEQPISDHDETTDLERKEPDYMKTKEKIPMKTSQPNNKVEESIYALLVRSEDKKRALLETIVYGLIILSALAAILQFTDQPVSFGA
jgi:hypothetical protein